MGDRIARIASEQRFQRACRGGLDASIVADARREIAALHKHGAMRPGGFTVAGRDDVVKAIVDKLVRRHPHVFGDASVDASSEVLENWERIKAAEKQYRYCKGEKRARLYDIFRVTESG